MSTVIEIANDLAKSFVLAESKKHAAQRIVIELSCLAYTDTKQSIDFDLKKTLLHLIFELVSGQRAFEVKNGERFFTTSKDGYVFSEMLHQLEKKLSAVAKPQLVEEEETPQAYYLWPFTVQQ